MCVRNRGADQFERTHILGGPVFGGYVICKEEFLAGIAAYDEDNHLYFQALHNLQKNWGDPTKMADAIWPWLRSWHAPSHRWGSGDPNAIASAIKGNIEKLTDFRARTIDMLRATDQRPIRTLFWAFSKGTGRTNSTGVQTSPVGSAKVLHLLSPGLLPLWDDKISNHYRCHRDAFGYIKFLPEDEAIRSGSRVLSRQTVIDPC
jgi:hypothetical protein